MGILAQTKKHLLTTALLIMSVAPASGQSWEDVEQAWNDNNPDKAFEILTSLGESGNPEAQFEIGLIYLNGEGKTQDDKKSFHWIRRSAENGLPQGQYALAIAYQIGLSVEKDVRNQMWWTRLAAINGYPEAQYMLGLAYSNPFMSDDLDFPYSAREGIYWLTKAANQDHDEGMFLLGILYRDGGLEKKFKDSDKSKYWITRAAEHGNEDAKKSLTQIEEK